jgi:hypothetical protein
MKNLVRLLLALVAVLGILVAAGAGWWFGFRSKPNEVRRVDSAPVVQAVRSVAKLATVQIEIADVIRYEEVRTILMFEFPKNATLRLRGTVLGGFDLSSGFTITPDEATKTLKINLPAPKVLSVDSRVEWFDETSGWVNPITADDRTRWLNWSRGAIGKAARDAGLEQRAAQHAREFLTGVANAFGWNAVVTVEGEKR